MPFTYQDFHKSWQDIHDKVPSYRYGQHFINLFIKDEMSNEVMFKGFVGKPEMKLMNKSMISFKYINGI